MKTPTNKTMLPDHLCRGLLVYLSVRKRSISCEEYFVVLTPSRLLFYHNNEEWVASHAAIFDVYVPSIVALEDISGQESIGQRSYVFQIIVSERTTDERKALACSASSAADFALWIDCLNKARLSNEVWLIWYHPGTFDDKWSCCNRTAKLCEGCIPTTNCAYPSVEDPLFRRKGYPDPYVGYGAILNRIARLQPGVTLNRGDHVTVLDFVKTDESLVLVASAVNPQVQGTLPKVLLMMGDIREEAWFFQELPPTLATALLQCMTSGTFLVRSFRRRLALSIVVDDTVRHHWIHQDEKGLCYVEAELRFPTIQEMVLFYSRQPRLGHRLNQFPKRENLEKLWHLDKKQLELKKELYSQHLPFIHHSGTYGPVPVMGVSSRPKQSRSEVDVLRKTARLLMCLDHQNLVRLIGVYHDEPTFTLVLEEVPPLTTFIASYGFERLQQEWEILVTFAHHLATALLYLHRKGIVHNEVVVENCFLQTDTFTAKLGNFQYARFEDCRPDSYQEELLQRHSRLVLSPPEVARQGQVSSCQTDIWGFGLLLWALFQSGGQPCSIVNVQQLINCRWSNLLPELAAVLGQLAFSCMHEVPQLRISAYELAKQLRNLLDLRKHLKGQTRSHSSHDMVYDHRAMNTSSTSEVTSSSPQLTVKAKKKRRFLRSTSRKTSNSGADSPSSTTASSLENVQFQQAHHSRSASTSPASGLLKGLRGLFGPRSGGSSAPSPTVSMPASSFGHFPNAEQFASATLPPVVKSTSFTTAIQQQHPQHPPVIMTGNSSGGSIRNADQTRGSDSNETLSWDGWSPISDVALTSGQDESELQFQYDRLREYCRSLLLKLKRERRERIRLTSELARVREELECRVMEAESENRQKGREHAVQTRANEERIRRLQATLAELQEQLGMQSPSAQVNGLSDTASPPSTSPTSPEGSNERETEVARLKENLRSAEQRLSAYEALTVKLQEKTSGNGRAHNGVILHPRPPIVRNGGSGANRDNDSSTSMLLRPASLSGTPSVPNSRHSSPPKDPGIPPPRPIRPPPAPPHRADSLSGPGGGSRGGSSTHHARSPGSDTSASSSGGLKSPPPAFGRSANGARTLELSTMPSPSRSTGVVRLLGGAKMNNNNININTSPSLGNIEHAKPINKSDTDTMNTLV